MKRKLAACVDGVLIGAGVLLLAALVRVLWKYVPRVSVRYGVLLLCGGIVLAAVLWALARQWQIRQFADDICETLDAAMADRQPENFHPYEDSLTASVQGKLLRYYEIMHDSRQESLQDKEMIQGLVSDISHQVKTPIANMKLYIGILQKPDLTEEKRDLFLRTLDDQISKLDFLMQSLIRMSRLETGTFVLHPAKTRLNDTIAQAMSAVWMQAEQKNIHFTVVCDPELTACHDQKWTAEALGNLLDNAVKYTPDGGNVTVTVRPWQFYVRIDIADTGIGISSEHYHDVFQRFYRAEEVAAQEGVGLGLYLANGIITRQKGYISVQSAVGKGTVFSVYLLT